MTQTPTSPQSIRLVDAIASRPPGVPQTEAEYLLLHALGKRIHERAWLRAHSDESVPTDAWQVFQDGCKQRAAGVPIAYITGMKEFRGLSLAIDARVLDPRPDTEVLVDWALEVLPEEQPCAAADLGTGSGAIALVLAHERPKAQIWAVDACADALTVARLNAERLQLPIQFCLGHWQAPLMARRLSFDLLVSNPPYIAALDPHLNALRHEPLKALVSGADGLDDIRHLVVNAPTVLKPGAWLLMEHGHDQAADVAQLMCAAGFRHVQHRNDLAGIARCTGGQWPGPSKIG